MTWWESLHDSLLRARAEAHLFYSDLKDCIRALIHGASGR